MKTGIISAILCLVSVLVFGQTKMLKPKMKQGLTLDYEIISQGQSIPLIMTVSAVSDAEIVIDYDFMGTTKGKFVNTRASLDKGGSLNWDEPVNGEERRLSENETIGMLSRPFLKELKANKKATYDGVVFILKPAPKGEEITVDGVTVDAVYAETESGTTRLWILNDDKYPVVLKIIGTAAGIDMIVKNIK